MNQDGTGAVYFEFRASNAKLQSDLAQTQKMFKGLGDNALSVGNRVNSTFKDIGRTIATVFTIDTAANFINQIVKVRGEIQALELSFETLLQSKTKADAMIAQIRQYAIDTPFDIKQISGAAQTLLAFNVPAERVMETIKQLGDVSAGNADRFKSMALAFGQASSAGKLMGQDLLQMINAGFNPLQEISARTGRSMADLRKDMENGKISMDMVTQGFTDATSEGGRFFGLMERQSQGVQGSIARLQDSFISMYNEIGESNEGLIKDVILGATSMVENYQEVGRTLMELVGFYGLYRAALMTETAVKGARETSIYVGQAAELTKLLTEEQKAIISKQNLNEATKEYVEAIKELIEKGVESKNSILEIARAEVEAAAEQKKFRADQLASARELLAKRKEELVAVQASGTAKKIETAQTKVNSAEETKNAALKSYRASMLDLNTKKTAVETAAKAANTTATAANTAATAANAVSTNILTGAMARASAMYAQFNKFIIANSYALAAAGVAALVYILYKLATVTSETEEAQKKLNESIRSAQSAVDAESITLDAHYTRLKRAKEGTKEYEAAKNAIMGKYGTQIAQLQGENREVWDLSKAYDQLKSSAIEAAKARAYESVTQQGANDYAGAQANSRSEIFKALNERFNKNGTAKGEALVNDYMRQYNEVLEGRMVATESFLKKFDSYSYGQLVNPIRDAITLNNRAKTQYENVLKEAGASFGLNNTQTSGKGEFNIKSASIDELIGRVSTLKNELLSLNKVNSDGEKITATQNEIAAINEAIKAREKSLDSIHSLKKRIEELDSAIETETIGSTEYKDLLSRKKALESRLPKTDAQVAKALKQDEKDEKEAARIRKETAEREERLSEMAKQLAETAAQGELDLSQQKINAMNDGFDKEMAQMDLNYKREQAENDKRFQDSINAEYERQKLIWEGNNPEKIKKGEVFKRSDMDFSQLDPAILARYDEYEKLANDRRLQSQKELLDKLKKEYETFEEQRLAITKKFQSDRENLEKAGLLSPKRKEIVDKEEEDTLKALDSEIAKRSEIFESWMGKLSSMTLKMLEEELRNAKEILELQESEGGSQAEIARLRAMIVELEKKIKDFDPEEDKKDEFKKKMDRWKTLGDSIDKVGRSLNEISGNFDEATQKAINFSVQVLNSTVQVIDNIIVFAEASTKVIEGASKAASTAIKSAEKASAIIGIISAVIQVVSAFKKLFDGNDAILRFNELVANTNRELALLNLRSQIDTGGKSIFGDDGWQRATKNLEVLKNAIQGTSDIYQDLVDSFNRSIDYQSDKFGLPNKEALYLKNDLEQINKFIQGISIEVSKGGWFKSAKTAKLVDLFPSLFNQDGSLNIKELELFIQTDAFEKLDEEAKVFFKNLVENAKIAEDALQSVKDYLSSMFGELGNTMTDIFVDSFKNGTDAAEAMFDAVGSMVEKFGSQLVYSLRIAPILAKYEQEALAVLGDNSLTDTEKNLQISKLVINAAKDVAGSAEDVYNDLENFQEEIKKEGISVFEPDDSRTGSSKVLAGLTQDQGDELNGRFTAIQGHTFVTMNTVLAIQKSFEESRSFAAIQLRHIANIDASTAVLPAMMGEIRTMRLAIETITDRGVKML